jgi:hypothetical protein
MVGSLADKVIDLVRTACNDEQGLLLVTVVH